MHFKQHVLLLKDDTIYLLIFHVEYEGKKHVSCDMDSDWEIYLCGMQTWGSPICMKRIIGQAFEDSVISKKE